MLSTFIQMIEISRSTKTSVENNSRTWSEKEKQYHHHSKKKILKRSFNSNFQKTEKKKKNINIKNQLKFRRFGGRIKGVRPTNRPLVLLLPQTSDWNSFNLDSIKHRQTNKLLYKMIYRVSWARYQPVESGSPSIERETCPLLPFPPPPLPRVPLDIVLFTTYVRTFYPILSPLWKRWACVSKRTLVGDQPRSSTVLWPGSD